ncbi:MAG: ABC-F family ATP-binding cassette domain-containing protein [Oligoflexia bacterium]|nr:ABC-F family ATP-binding cassette domain-containing protein [Oligoflexia bacterium]
MLHLHGISKQYGSKVLFTGAEAHLGLRSRVALVGPNGAGKSTLIKIILGLESPDEGVVSRASHLAIGYLAQEVPKFSGRSVLEEVMRVSDRREDLLQAKAELEKEFSEPEGTQEPDEERLARYGRVLEELEHLDEYRLESRAKEILSGMGFKDSDFSRPLTEFSGGWLMRVALSRVLLMDPDLLLLDEPTNHLDLESLLWLEQFLRAYRGALLLVSHDTEFLNRMVTEVLEIDQRKISSYRGNLDAWITQKQERMAVLRSQYDSQQSKIAEIEAFVERFGAKATKARQAQSRLKQLEKMELIEMPDERSTVRFRFPPAPHSGKEVVTLKSASVRFGEKTVFRDLDWVIRRGSRTAIVGVNGAGKTTLLRILAGAIEPSSGEVKLGHMVKPGYYAQHQAESLDMNKTILEELEAAAPEMPVAQVRAIAGAFLFTGDSVAKKCAVLSGGEKARVALAKLLLSPSNFLILDEPTNHLDVESRGVLLEALQDFEGTLVLVSHDRGFVTPLVDNVLEIEPSPSGSRVTPLVGSYEDYLERVEQRMRQTTPALSASAPKKAGANAPVVDQAATPKRPAISNNQKTAWARERDRLEAEITQHEQAQARLAAILADPATYDDKPKSLLLIEEQSKNEKALFEKLARWEELCAILEPTT